MPSTNLVQRGKTGIVLAAGSVAALFLVSLLPGFAPVVPGSGSAGREAAPALESRHIIQMLDSDAPFNDKRDYVRSLRGRHVVVPLREALSHFRRLSPDRRTGDHDAIVAELTQKLRWISVFERRRSRRPTV